MHASSSITPKLFKQKALATRKVPSSTWPNLQNTWVLPKTAGVGGVGVGLLIGRSL